MSLITHLNDLRSKKVKEYRDIGRLKEREVKTLLIKLFKHNVSLNDIIVNLSVKIEDLDLRLKKLEEVKV